MSLCELCQKPGGRYNANRECCQIRLLSTMPQQHRQQVYDKVRLQEGIDAAKALMAKVKAEYERVRGPRLARAKAAIQEMKNLIGAKA